MCTGARPRYGLTARLCAWGAGAGVHAQLRGLSPRLFTHVRPCPAPCPPPPPPFHQDHFVHRFTHRVVRGLLLAVGRPDGRLYSQAKGEAATLLAILQARVTPMAACYCLPATACLLGSNQVERRPRYCFFNVSILMARHLPPSPLLSSCPPDLLSCLPSPPFHVQAKVIQHLGGQPEVVSLGHNPYSPTTIIDRSLKLPTCR